MVDGPGRIPSHRELHPVFFGSLDWHSCVEMYWVAARIMRLCPGSEGESGARNAIASLLTESGIATEAAFFESANHRSFERPYGWGWLLALQSELDEWNDEQGQTWASILRPLSEVITQGFVTWLPMLTYPQRVGVHQNTAFALTRSLDFATARANDGDNGLWDAITTAADRMFLDDTDYPANYEPSGTDFLSAALSEAELMGRIMPNAAFPDWLASFLPGLENGDPPQLFTLATVSDGTDGQFAHLAGLNLSRAAGFLSIAAMLPDGDTRIPALHTAAETHANASLGSVSGSGYMLEHWLSAYATLLLTA